MNETLQRDYLQQVLVLDARSQAEEILRRRREFLQSEDVIVAALSGDDDDAADLRTRLLERLYEVRRDFWRIDVRELSWRLNALRSVSQAETAAAATRLQQVAAHHDAFRQLLAAPNLNQSFVQALAAILVASASEANRLREREHSRMRPERSPDFRAALLAIQGTVRFIQLNHPDVFEMEETWLTELLEYDPNQEVDGHVSLFGLLMLAGCGLTLLTNIVIVVWVFS